MCSDLGLSFETDPMEYSIDLVTLGTPALPIARSEGLGQCLFSSIYYLLTGKQSGIVFHFWT